MVNFGDCSCIILSPFPKLEKHLPINLYMLYPMAQSVARVCVEIDNKKALQRHCPLSSSPSSKFFLVRGHISAFHCWRSQQHPSVMTGCLTSKVQAHRVNIHIHSYKNPE
jgi:hypothetical protein